MNKENIEGALILAALAAVVGAVFALPNVGEPASNAPSHHQLVAQSPAAEAQPDVPARKPDDDTIVTQCSADDFVYGHAWMDVKVATMGVVHPGGKHEAPVVVYTFDEKMDIVKLWYNGVAVADVDAWIKSHSNLCAYMVQKDS